MALLKQDPTGWAHKARQVTPPQNDGHVETIGATADHAGHVGQTHSQACPGSGVKA